MEPEVLTFTCPACDNPQRVRRKARKSKIYRCCFCYTETPRAVAKKAGLLTNPNLRKMFDQISAYHTKLLDQLNGLKSKGKGKK